MPKLSFLVLLSICGAALVTLPLSGQDDSGNAPPADPAAAPSDTATAASNDASEAPDSGASFQTFYDALGSQGTWIQSADYGYVWQPQQNDPSWAPYTEGHWVYTDDGWTWASDESFGWATYHYGRWVNLDATGWCWVPGYTWAPAWVSWRYGDGYAGWAPLPPDSFVGIDYSDDGLAIGVGFHIGGDCDGFYGIGAGCYNFLPVTCLGYRNYHGYYCHRGENYAIINRTTNVTNINVSRGGVSAEGGEAGHRHFGRVTAGGPMLAQVNAASASPVSRVNLVRTHQPGGGGMVSGNSLALFAPRVNPGATAQPARVDGSIGKVTINRGVDVTRPLAVNSRLTGEPATEAQVQQARISAGHSPAGAKVMTDEARVRPVLQAPLTSMRPVARESMLEGLHPPEAAPSSNEFSKAQQGPVVAPSTRIYPQTGDPARAPSRTYYPNTAPGSTYYQPRSTTIINSGGNSEPRANVRPGSPAGSYPTPVAPTGHPSAPAEHESQGGRSGGEGVHADGGGNRGQSGGGGREGSGSGSSHSGGNSQQGH